MDMGDSVALSANTNNPGSVTWSDLSGIPSGISISNINNKLTFTVTGAVSSPNLDFPIKANFYHTELSASLQ
ncbi:hypothetical protein FACS1894166_08250 [Bacilli bacterium]|nr:hypothetical protein FACS1894166_08250 [Bacilli bacterium]